MRNVTLEELLEAGCHFGHQVTRQNPRSRDFVFEARDNIHIIDLEKTKEGLEAAGEFVKSVAQKNGTMVLLGAKRQAETVVRDEVKRAEDQGIDGLYYVTQRWIGGIFTNFPEVSKNFRRLKELAANLNNEFEKSKYTKKEISLWEKERAKLDNFYGGVAEMKGTPDAIFIIDTHLEDLAVREARATGVKSVGITDTNSDPTLIDYPIPANDDALGSIELITKYIVDAWIEGKKTAKGDPSTELRAGAQSAEGKTEEKKAKPKKKADKVEKQLEDAALDIDGKTEKETEMVKRTDVASEKAASKTPAKKAVTSDKKVTRQAK